MVLIDSRDKNHVFVVVFFNSFKCMPLLINLFKILTQVLKKIEIKKRNLDRGAQHIKQ